MSSKMKSMKNRIVCACVVGANALMVAPVFAAETSGTTSAVTTVTKAFSDIGATLLTIGGVAVGGVAAWMAFQVPIKKGLTFFTQLLNRN